MAYTSRSTALSSSESTWLISAVYSMRPWSLRRSYLAATWDMRNSTPFSLPDSNRSKAGAPWNLMKSSASCFTYSPSTSRRGSFSTRTVNSVLFSISSARWVAS